MDELRAYRTSEAASILGISRAKLYQLLARQELRSISIDGCRRIPHEWLAAYRAQRMAAAEAEYDQGGGED